jgi:DNA-binding CsgD family transcriptional regulator
VTPDHPSTEGVSAAVMRWDATVRRSAARDVRAAIADAGRRAVEPLTLELDVVRQIDRVVPFDRWCGLVTDPVTAHPTGGYHDEGLPPPRLPRLLEIENGDEPDFVSLRALARSRTRARTLGEATKGDLARSPRYRDVLEPSGVRHEVRVALRCSSGAWGALVLMRGTDAPDFTPAEVDLLSAVSPVVAEGLCRTIVLGRRPTAPGTGPGLLLCTVGDEISVDHANEPARRRLTELDDASTGGLPYSIACLVQSARHQPAGLGPWRARMRTRTHEWITVHAERLGPTLVSVILEPTRPHEIAQLWADAHGLTAREREVTGLAVRGLTNAQIADALFLSPYTVQDYLKQIFIKTGVVGRTELAAALLPEVGAPLPWGPARHGAAEPSAPDRRPGGPT